MLRKDLPLESILSAINDRLEKRDEVREVVLKLTRQTIKWSSKAIKAIHNEKMEEAGKALEEARTSLMMLEEKLKDCPILASWGTITQSYQEFVEARVLKYFVEGGNTNGMPTPESLESSDLAYLLGLGDVVGELRRYCLDRLRRKDLSEAERALEFANALFEGLTGLDQFQEAIIPGVRRKCDVARILIEKTRGDVTNAYARLSLEQQIIAFFDKIKKGVL